jgi:hypothetical protein
MNWNIFLVIAGFLLVTLEADAQPFPKRYVLIEHFTNTKCGNCAARNPAFYTTLSAHAAEVHHLAIHPSVPYSSCALYQANTADNSARSAYYGVSSTPSVALNGSLKPPSNPLLSPNALQAVLNDVSPLWLQVAESGTGSNRTVKITAHSVGEIPAGNYQLYVALSEKTVLYNAPNGESTHRDVLRKLIPSNSGISFIPAPVGQQVTLEIPYTIQAGWSGSEIYALAFVQNTTTKEVLNSGTRFDPVFTPTAEPEVGTLRTYPNPSSGSVAIDLPDASILTFQVADLRGNSRPVSWQIHQNTLLVQMDTEPKGVYYFRLTTTRGAYTGQIVRQ